MVYKIKNFFKVTFSIFTISLCITGAKAIYIIDEYDGGYRRVYYPSVLVNMSNSRTHGCIRTIFTVKFKDPENTIVYSDEVPLFFVPDISDEEQIIQIIEIAFPGFYDRKNFYLESVMRLAETSNLPATVSVHVMVPY